MAEGSFILAKILGSWGIFSISRLVLYKQGIERSVIMATNVDAQDYTAVIHSERAELIERSSFC